MSRTATDLAHHRQVATERRAQRYARRFNARVARRPVDMPPLDAAAGAGHNLGPALDAPACLTASEIRAQCLSYAPQDVLRVVLASPYEKADSGPLGETLTGSYMTVAGMSFIAVKSARSLLGEVTVGDLADLPVLSIERVETRCQVLARRFARERGELVRYEVPTSAAGYRCALDTLADAAAAVSDWHRHRQIERQFNDLADQIQLAQEKRAWILGQAKRRRAGETPAPEADGTRTDDFRPLPMDFEPDTAKRRNRGDRAAYRSEDPVYAELVLMLRRFRAAGLQVDRRGAALLVRFAMKHGKAAAFYYQVGADGRTPSVMAEDNHSQAATRRLFRAQKLPAYAAFMQLVRQRLGELRGPAKVTTSAGPYRRPEQLSLF